MIVPTYWAEARVHVPRRRDRGAVTVRRYGWSDVSPADAQAMADARAQDALAAITAGKALPRFEPKRGYNGADGVPIREEIVSRHGPDIVTRNSYGARCLNTPDVLFADIDFDRPHGSAWVVAHVLGAMAAAVALTRYFEFSIGWTLLYAFVAAVVAPFLALAHAFVLMLARGGPQADALRRARAFVRRFPAWRLRLYRTPAGLRVLALHAPFASTDPNVEAFFAALRVDPVYARMCRHQRCFRARLSAKPWRAGFMRHLKPRTAVWPLPPDRLPVRQAWIRDYEHAAASYAACAFLEEIGSAPVHPRAAAVRDLHDRECRALSGLPLA